MIFLQETNDCGLYLAAHTEHQAINAHTVYI